MRLALVGPSQPYRGGISQYNTQLYFRLQTLHEVLLVNFRRLYPGLLFPGTTQFNDPRQDPMGESLIDTINPLSWVRTARCLVDFRPDAVLFQWWHPFFGLAYWPILKALGRQGSPASCRRLFLCHNVYPHERAPGALGRRLERRFIQSLFARVDGFVTQSEAMVEQIRELGSRAPIKKVFHPCYEQFGRAEESPVPPQEDCLRLLFFGTIRRYKGVDVLLEALALLPSELPWKLRVAGEFYQTGQELTESAQRLGISERIEWEARYIPDSEVSSHFHWAQVVIAPYRRASQSGVIPLAYQFGLPVITTSTGGLSEIVREGETGLLVPPNSAPGLARAIGQFARLRDTVPWRRNVAELRSMLSWKRVEDAILSLAQRA